MQGALQLTSPYMRASSPARLKNAFLLYEAARYDVKGRHYLNYPIKYYATDPGLRNARINFHQTEPTHLMELDFLLDPNSLETL